MTEIKDYKVKPESVKQARINLLEYIGCCIPEGRFQGKQLDMVSKLLDNYIRLRDKAIKEYEDEESHIANNNDHINKPSG